MSNINQDKVIRVDTSFLSASIGGNLGIGFPLLGKKPTKPFLSQAENFINSNMKTCA